MDNCYCLIDGTVFAFIIWRRVSTQLTFVLFTQIELYVFTFGPAWTHHLASCCELRANPLLLMNTDTTDQYTYCLTERTTGGGAGGLGGEDCATAARKIVTP